jgi:hypothetical protein
LFKETRLFILNLDEAALKPAETSAAERKRKLDDENEETTLDPFNSLIYNTYMLVVYDSVVCGIFESVWYCIQYLTLEVLQINFRSFT